MKLLLAPHNDDEALFVAYTCMREKPLIVVMTDSYIQPNRGERGCSADERWKESVEAANILGCPILRIGLHDDTLTEDDIRTTLKKFVGFDIVYAPAVQGGNWQHDLIGKIAQEVFTSVIEYTTYTKTELWTMGNKEVMPNTQEKMLKIKALQCYESQLRINYLHFKEVFNRSEWYL